MPTLAVIEGFAIGGGLAIAAGVRSSHRDSRLALRRSDRAHARQLSLDGELRAPGRRLGASRAKRMLLLAENLVAEEALAAGFLSEIVAAGRARPARR